MILSLMSLMKKLKSAQTATTKEEILESILNYLTQEYIVVSHLQKQLIAEATIRNQNQSKKIMRFIIIMHGHYRFRNATLKKFKKQ